MADITLNSAVRSNLRTLQSTSDLLAKTEQRISTGKKVNSALDNPSSFFTAQALNRRSSDLNNILDSVSNSVQTLQAADNGIKAISDVVESLKATARSALQSEAVPLSKEYTYTAQTAATTLTIGGKAVNLAASATAQDAVDAINSAGVDGVSASLDAGKVKLTSSKAVTVVDDATNATGIGGNIAATDVDTTSDAYKKRDDYRQQFNDALKQINSLAKDASYNGVNLLQGDDLSIVFNEDGSSKLDVKGASLGASGLGLDSLAEGDFGDKTKINATLDKITSAFSTLESQSSQFGSQLQIVQTRQDFTKNMVGTLKDGASALTDADTNEEAANLATLQTRQSLIVSSLSISTSSEQNILQLLR